VTALVLGDGPYVLTGFGAGALVNTNGASIVAFYSDGNAANNRDVVLFEGNDSNIDNAFDPLGWTVTLGGITYTGGTASMQLHIADGQNFIDDALLVNSVVKFPISNWAGGFSVPGMNNGPQNDGRLWDIINVDVSGELAAAGPPPQALQLTTGVASDCLALTAAIVDLPAGAAPGNLDIDIKPGSWPNSINTKNKGVIPVAILGSDVFDVTTVDVTTLVFGPTGASPAHDLTDPLVYADHLQDVNSDGYMDLVSHYATQEAGFAVGDTEGCIDGSTLSAAPIHGCDAVRIVK